MQARFWSEVMLLQDEQKVTANTAGAKLVSGHLLL